MFDLLDAEKATGVVLTENFAMLPAASVSGFYFASPGAHYFGVGRIGRDQVEDYARRKGITVETAEKWARRALATRNLLAQRPDGRSAPGRLHGRATPGPRRDHPDMERSKKYLDPVISTPR